MRPINRKLGEWLLQHNHLQPKTHYTSSNEACLHLSIQMGPYCAFCEMQMSVHIDFKVEHALPYQVNLNTNFPDDLLLVCPFCSDYRHHFIQPGTIQLADLILPNRDNSFDFFVYEFSTKHLKKDLVNAGLLEILPSSPHTASTLNKSYKQVWVLPNPAYQHQPVLYEKIKHAIRTLGLNHYLPPSINAIYPDPRVEKRTHAWVNATKATAILETYYVSKALDPNKSLQRRKFYDLLKKQTAVLAIYTGFWSTWMTVFLQKKFKQDEIRNQLICELLLQNFPGTRYTLANFDCPPQSAE